jgi:hypothetical protein
MIGLMTTVTFNSPQPAGVSCIAIATSLRNTTKTTKTTKGLAPFGKRTG